MTSLPPDWTLTPLEDLAEILDSMRVPVNSAERQQRVGNVPYYGATGQVGWIDSPLFDEELVLLGEDGAPFLDPSKPKAYIIRGPSWVNNHAHVLRARSLTTNRYLSHALNAIDYRPYVNGTTRLKLTQTAMRGIPLPLPPPNEQRRIVETIDELSSHLDVGDKALETALTKLSLAKERAFYAAFSSTTHKFITLGEIADVIGGVAKDAKRENDRSFVEIPYLRVANVQRGYLDLSQVKTIRVPPTVADSLELRCGDILFTEGGDRDKLGRGCVWASQLSRCIHQNHIFRARLLDDNFEPRFVSMYGNSIGRDWFQKMGKQTTNLASLNLNTLKQFPIPIIPFDLQRQIVEDVEQLNTVYSEMSKAVSNAVKRSIALRMVTFSMAFSGRLVPNSVVADHKLVLT